VRHAAIAPAAFRRFQVGDAAPGGFLALQAALRDFHRTHYVARRMQLWLQGPQSLEALGELAARFAAGLAPRLRRRRRRSPGRALTAAGGLQPARAVALPADRLK
jgi:secreted Zn-dependent insulinase-like peptidase